MPACLALSVNGLLNFDHHNGEFHCNNQNDEDNVVPKTGIVFTLKKSMSTAESVLLRMLMTAQHEVLVESLLACSTI